MQKLTPLKSQVLVLLLALLFSCSRKAYVANNFDEKTTGHKVVAILPAEMIFTGKQPKDLTPEDIARIEEQESTEFQIALYNSVLRHANTRKYITTINFQDANTTLKLLKENDISVKESWDMNDKELSRVLGVDGIVRMQIRKQRYMSDEASYAIDAGRNILNSTGIASKIPLPVPARADKTNDIYASCNLVSDGIGLWNDNYKAYTNWNNKPSEVIERITDEFGTNFPYKRKRR